MKKRTQDYYIKAGAKSIIIKSLLVKLVVDSGEMYPMDSAVFKALDKSYKSFDEFCNKADDAVYRDKVCEDIPDEEWKDIFYFNEIFTPDQVKKEMINVLSSMIQKITDNKKF